MSSNQLKLKSFVACCALCFGHMASAGTIVCSGTVTAIAMHANNILMVQLSSMNEPVYFCNTEQNSVVAGYSTGPSMCKTLFALFLTAKTTGNPVNGVYFDLDGTAPSSCGAFPSWTYANIRHFVYQ